MAEGEGYRVANGHTPLCGTHDDHASRFVAPFLVRRTLSEGSHSTLILIKRPTFR